MRLILVIAGILVMTMAACVGDTPLTELADITSETEDGFYDLTFRVADQHRLADGGILFRGIGRYGDERVGLELVLGPAWEQISLGADLPKAFRGKVEIRSVGAESDALLRAMDHLYGTKLNPQAMNTAVTFTGITLEGNPRDPVSRILKIKLFFEPDDQDRYAELYANIDLTAGKIYVNEKDTDYRTPVIRALAESRDGG